MKKNFLRFIVAAILMVTTGTVASAADVIAPTLRNKNISIDELGANYVKISWDNAVDNETAVQNITYSVFYRQMSLGDPEKWTQAYIKQKSTCCTITGQRDKLIEIKVVAYDAAGNSATYNMASARVPGNSEEPIPDQPAQVTDPEISVATSYYNNSCKASITWNPAELSKTAAYTSYNVVVMSKDGNDSFTETLEFGKNGCIIEGLKPGTTYVVQLIGMDNHYVFYHYKPTPYQDYLWSADFTTPSTQSAVGADPVIPNRVVNLVYATDKRMHLNWKPAATFNSDPSKLRYRVDVRKKGASEWTTMRDYNKETKCELIFADNEANTDFEIRVTAQDDYLNTKDYVILNAKTKSKQGDYPQWPNGLDDFKVTYDNVMAEVSWNPAVSPVTPADQLRYAIRVLRINKDGSKSPEEVFWVSHGDRHFTYPYHLVSGCKYTFRLYVLEDPKYVDWENWDGYGYFWAQQVIEPKTYDMPVRIEYITRVCAHLYWDPLPGVPAADAGKVQYQVYGKRSTDNTWTKYDLPTSETNSHVYLFAFTPNGVNWAGTNFDLMVKAIYNGKETTLGAATGKTWLNDTTDPKWPSDPLQIVNCTNTSATVGWNYATDNCDHPVDIHYWLRLYVNGNRIFSKTVKYGAGFGPMPDNVPLRYTFTDLTPNTTYEFDVVAEDQSGNQSTSPRKSFSTFSEAPTDVNGDGTTNISDVTTLINKILNKK